MLCFSLFLLPPTPSHTQAAFAISRQYSDAQQSEPGPVKKRDWSNPYASTTSPERSYSLGNIHSLNAPLPAKTKLSPNTQRATQFATLRFASSASRQRPLEDVFSGKASSSKQGSGEENDEDDDHDDNNGKRNNNDDDDDGDGGDDSDSVFDATDTENESGAGHRSGSFSRKFVLNSSPSSKVGGGLFGRRASIATPAERTMPSGKVQRGGAKNSSNNNDNSNNNNNSSNRLGIHNTHSGDESQTSPVSMRRNHSHHGFPSVKRSSSSTAAPTSTSTTVANDKDHHKHSGGGFLRSLSGGIRRLLSSSDTLNQTETLESSSSHHAGAGGVSGVSGGVSGGSNAQLQRKLSKSGHVCTPVEPGASSCACGRKW